MERFFRFLIGLSLSGFVAILGFALTGYSVIQMYNAYQDYQDFAEKKAVFELVSALKNDGVNYVEIAEKVFFLIGFLPLILIIPGLLLFGFGIKLMVRKISQGLPEAAKKPESEAELWGSTAIYGFGVFLTAPAIFMGVVGAPEYVPVVFHSVETPGIAVKVTEIEPFGNGSRGTSIVQIEFTDLNGRRAKADLKTSVPFADNLRRHPDIEIAYVPGRTDKIYSARSVPSISGYLWSYIWRLGMLYVAVCGLLANFMPNKSAPTSRLGALTQPNSNNNLTTETAQRLRQRGRNNGFGRRGTS
ncbi:hypothetical protein [Labrenzia sp. PHM005]|uniref:hypothetical protein n=1 Tax=Labrenzia sp. PHM005 TaxID=2590016 RepID=UPI00113FEF19|nr:hypothetical protein [Labrenzia sp. PHM005]QDG77155.1 hypothetical protein FJ695_15450 [Labrenzia sp. PHM005]